MSSYLCLKWNDHMQTFCKSVSGFRQKSMYTDATLACDSSYYHVHKIVLSSCSEYFAELFAKTPCTAPVIVLKDLKCTEVEDLLNFMYLGEVEIAEERLADLLKAATYLKIKGLATNEGLYQNLNCGKRKRNGEDQIHTSKRPNSSINSAKPNSSNAINSAKPNSFKNIYSNKPNISSNAYNSANNSYRTFSQHNAWQVVHSRSVDLDKDLESLFEQPVDENPKQAGIKIEPDSELLHSENGGSETDTYDNNNHNADDFPGLCNGSVAKESNRQDFSIVFSNLNEAILTSEKGNDKQMYQLTHDCDRTKNIVPDASKKQSQKNCSTSTGDSNNINEKIMLCLESNNTSTNNLSLSESKHFAVEHCVYCLVHAKRCKDDKCSLNDCAKMKALLRHNKMCRKKTNGVCTTCKNLIVLCYFHARDCAESLCNIPYCNSIKSKPKYDEVQLRLVEKL